jgi:hypothetical protein
MMMDKVQKIDTSNSAPSSKTFRDESPGKSTSLKATIGFLIQFHIQEFLQ